MRIYRILLYTAALFICSSVCGQYLSPSALLAGDDGIFVMCHTGNKILVLDESTGERIREITLDGPPAGMCMGKEGRELYVTSGTAPGRIQRIDAATGKVIAQADAGHSPCSPVLIGERHIAYADRFAGKVTVCDINTLVEIRDIPVSREPVCMVWSPQEKILAVTHLLPEGGAFSGNISAPVTLISSEDFSVVKKIPLRNGSGSARHITLSPDGRYAVATHILARYTLHTSQVEQGWQNTNAFTLIDMREREIYRTVLLDDVYRGAASPWGSCFSVDGKTLYITHAGSHEVSIIDFAALLDKAAQNSSGRNFYQMSFPGATENDLSFIASCRERIPLKGNGPRGVYEREGKIWTADYFSDAVEIIEDTPTGKASRLIVLNDTPPDAIRRGEMLFNDASICFENWQSCASCHPDARSDGFSWDLMNDKVGNPKNVLSLLYSHHSPPAMSTGIRPNAEYAVRAGIRLIQFAEPDERDASDIDEYLRSLNAVPSPYLIGGELSPRAKKGEALFEKYGCTECHNGKYYSDRKLHDIGTHSDYDFTTRGDSVVAQNEFVTARLTEMWRTAPYLHDGSCYTLEELFDKGSHKYIRQAGEKLSTEEKQNIIEYILSL